MFGGGNARSLYTPMSETEQEALSRLVETGDLVLEVKGFGVIPLQQVIVGDHRLGIRFQIQFQTKNNAVVKVSHLNLELRTRSGIKLFAEQQAFTGADGNPMLVSTGLVVPMQWDIGINQIDPKVVKAILPSVIGLTTRRGNERMTDEQRKTLAKLREDEKRARASTKQMVDDAARKVDSPTVTTPKKIAP